jgi:hypothetical protein
VGFENILWLDGDRIILSDASFQYSPDCRKLFEQFKTKSYFKHAIPWVRDRMEDRPK